MGRKAKNKQAPPPTLEEFKSEKKPKLGKSANSKKNLSSASSVSLNSKKKSLTNKPKIIDNNKSKNNKNSNKVINDKESIQSTKKALFDDDDDDDDEDMEIDEFDLDLQNSSDEEQIDNKKSKDKKKNKDKSQTKIKLNSNLDNELNSNSDLENDSDNDSDIQKNSIFSDDEGDENDLEAANLYSLSKTLNGSYDENGTSDNDESDNSSNFSSDENLDIDDNDDDEIQTNIEAEREKSLLPSGQEIEQNAFQPPDLVLLKSRILEITKVLSNYSAEKRTHSRTEYVDQLISDISTYYGYSPYMAEKLFHLFSPAEALEFFEANEVPRPITIRTNTLKTRRRDLAQALVNRGVNLKPIPWSKVGLTVFDSQVPIGATPEYLAGHYILQAASSYLPVMALAPKPGETILDMASAPGGKTTHMCSLMRNEGILLANDANKSRAKGLIANIARLGCHNTVVCNYDAREFPKVVGGFDRVLLDAPCSGAGVISKDPSVKTNRTEKDYIQLPHLQKQLLMCALDSVNADSPTGGYVVYSTCSVMVEENEGVVNYILQKRKDVKLVETGLEIGKDAFTSYRGKHFDPSLKLAKRYYPHTYNVDGFFVAKFKKLHLPSTTDSSTLSAKSNKTKLDFDFIDQTVGEFTNFDDPNDNTYIEKSKEKNLRKKGLNPKAIKAKKKKLEM